MEIPDSISNLTADSNTADPFNYTTPDIIVNTGKIIDIIKHNTPSDDYISLEEGLAFYKKDIHSDKNFIKNFLLLYSDVLSRTVQTSNIGDDYKLAAQKAIIENIKSIQSSLDAIGDLINTLNKQKNILDVKRISFIMLGYAIGTIKKIYHN
jgi:hypothetical protein